MVDNTAPIPQPDARPLTHVEAGQVDAIQRQRRIDAIRAPRAELEAKTHG